MTSTSRTFSIVGLVSLDPLGRVIDVDRVKFVTDPFAGSEKN